MILKDGGVTIKWEEKDGKKKEKQFNNIPKADKFYDNLMAVGAEPVWSRKILKGGL